MWSPEDTDGQAQRIMRVLERIGEAGIDPDSVDVASLQLNANVMTGTSWVSFTYTLRGDTRAGRIEGVESW